MGAKCHLDDADMVPKKHRVVHDYERAAFGARDGSVQFVEVDLAVHVTLDDPRCGDVLQDVALSQTAVDEKVDPNAFVRAEDLEVVRLFDGRDEAPDARDFYLLGLVVIRVLGECLVQVLDERVVVFADLPQELRLLRELLERRRAAADREARGGVVPSG